MEGTLQTQEWSIQAGDNEQRTECDLMCLRSTAMQHTTRPYKATYCTAKHCDESVIRRRHYCHSPAPFNSRQLPIRSKLLARSDAAPSVRRAVAPLLPSISHHARRSTTTCRTHLSFALRPYRQSSPMSSSMKESSLSSS